MKTPKDYIDKGKSIVPCEGKKPYHKDWDNKDFTINDFKPGDNIGLKLVDDVDIDIETPISNPFINRYIQPCSAVYGRGKRPRSHLLFKGKAKHKKFVFHKDLESYYKNLPQSDKDLYEFVLENSRSQGQKGQKVPSRWHLKIKVLAINGTPIIHRFF